VAAIGDFGPTAYQFVDFLAAAVKAYGRCCRWDRRPMETLLSSTSAFAGNPLLVSVERLAAHGWIDPPA